MQRMPHPPQAATLIKQPSATPSHYDLLRLILCTGRGKPLQQNANSKKKKQMKKNQTEKKQQIDTVTKTKKYAEPQ